MKIWGTGGFFDELWWTFRPRPGKVPEQPWNDPTVQAYGQHAQARSQHVLRPVVCSTNISSCQGHVLSSLLHGHCRDTGACCPPRNRVW